MSRRRLEIALQAGKAIEQGTNIATSFEKLQVNRIHKYAGEKEGIFSLQYNFGASCLAVGYGDGSVEVLSTSTGDVQRDFRKRMGLMAVTCIRFRPTEHHVFLAATSEGKVCYGSVVDGTSQVVITEHNNEINCLDFNLESTHFATAGRDLSIRIYDASTSQVSKVYEGYGYATVDQATSGHAQRIFALRYHPEYNHVLVTGGWDNHIKIWDVRTPTGVTSTIHGPHICGDSLDLKGRQILTGSWRARDALQLWEFPDGRLVKTIPFSVAGGEPGTGPGSGPGAGHGVGDGPATTPPAAKGEFLYCAQFCDGDVVIAGGSGTCSVQAIHVPSGKKLGEVFLGHPVQAMDSTQGGRLLAAGGGGGSLHQGQLTSAT